PSASGGRRLAARASLSPALPVDAGRLSRSAAPGFRKAVRPSLHRPPFPAAAACRPVSFFGCPIPPPAAERRARRQAPHPALHPAQVVDDPAQRLVVRLNHF